MLVLLKFRCLNMEKLNAIKISDNIKKINDIKIFINPLIRGKKPYSSRFENISSVQSYYDNIIIDFKKSLYKQLIEKCDSNLLFIYIEEAKEVNDQINKDILNYDINPKYNSIQLLLKKNDTIFNNDEYKLGENILKEQNKIIEEVLIILENTLRFIDYSSTEDYKLLLSELETNIIQEDLTHSNNRASFNLSKSDSIMFIYMLEKCNLIKFESLSHRNSFIEQNFNYSDLRNVQSENKVQPMKGVSVEFSNIKSNDKSSLKRFNKNLESLKDKLQIIMDFKLES